MRVVHLFLEYPNPFQPYNESLINNQKKYGIEAFPISMSNKAPLFNHCKIMLIIHGKISMALFSLVFFTIRLNQIIKVQKKSELTLRQTIVAFRRFGKIIKLNPDVVHVHHYIISDELFDKFLAAYKIPWCYSIRGRDVNVVPYFDDNSFKKVNFTFKRATGLHAVSISLKQSAIKLGCPQDKINVIYRSSEKRLKFVKTKYDLHDPVAILYVGRFNWVKGIIFLLLALRKLITDEIPAQLHICGSGKDYELEEIMFTIKYFSLKNNVIFHGYVNDNQLELLLPDIDFFIQPSLDEGIPNTLIKIIQTGIPTISTCVGGIPELIKDNWNGCIIPPYSGDALAKKIKELINNNTLREFIGENAKNTSWQSPQIEFKKYYDFYLKLISLKSQKCGAKLI